MHSNNDPREAPSDVSICQNYAFTIAVFPKKLIDGKQFQYLDKDNQHTLIQRCISNALHTMELSASDVRMEVVYELTSNDNYHCHGIMTCDVNTISEFQQKIHKTLGLPKVSPQRVCYIEQTQLNRSAWIQYMNKEIKPPKEDFIPDYSMFAS